MKRRLRPALAALFVVTACHSCTVCTPDAERTRRIDGHEVVITAEGTRRVGVEGAGAPHVFGVLWPTIEGYGYELRVRIDDRPEVELGTAGTGEDRMPTERELAAYADAVEVAFSPNGEHLVYRRDATTGWRLLHMLPKGRPFDAADSDRFARDIVPASALDLASVPSSRTIGLEILRRDEGEAGGDHARRRAFWDALGAQPGGPPWDDALLVRWPGDSRAHVILVAHARPGSGSTDPFRDALITKAFEQLRADRRVAQRATDVVVATGRDARIRELESTLLGFWPEDGTTGPLVERLRATHDDRSRASLRDAGRDKALAVLTRGDDASTQEPTIDAAIDVYVAAAGEACPRALYAPLAARWPTSEAAHDFLLACFDGAPADVQRALGERARPLLADSSAIGSRAARIRCRYAMAAGSCEEVQALAGRVRSGCTLPDRCR